MNRIHWVEGEGTAGLTANCGQEVMCSDLPRAQEPAGVGGGGAAECGARPKGAFQPLAKFRLGTEANKPIILL